MFPGPQVSLSGSPNRGPLHDKVPVSRVSGPYLATRSRVLGKLVNLVFYGKLWVSAFWSLF